MDDLDKYLVHSTGKLERSKCELVRMFENFARDLNNKDEGEYSMFKRNIGLISTKVCYIGIQELLPRTSYFQLFRPRIKLAEVNVLDIFPGIFGKEFVHVKCFFPEFHIPLERRLLELSEKLDLSFAIQKVEYKGIVLPYRKSA